MPPSMRVSRLALLLSAALVTLVTANDHKLERLPGLRAEDAPFAQYAGQLRLSAGEKLFYWYAESHEAPETAPLVLWLNGGPGCSSLGGFFTENGPFVVGSDLTLRRNPYAWNRKAHLVWLESPAGVGFSGPAQPREYYTDDTTAATTREFLQLFLAKYPALQGRPLFVTGESYAGIYVPYLVELLLREPVAGASLAGFAVGNAYTDPPTEGNALFDYYVSHAMISPSVYRSVQAACAGDLAWVYTGENTSQACAAAASAGFEAAGHGHFNIFYIYGDVCLVDSKQVAALRKSIGGAPAGLAASHRGDIGVCADVLTQAYLNQPSVQEALHVEDAPVDWADCSDDVAESYTPSASALPKYADILGKGLKALIYNGDADSDVSFIGSLRWIGEPSGLGLRVTKRWAPWFGPDKQLAGYAEEYEGGLTFKTVKGAGHLVPAVRPLHALHLLECFVFGADACARFSYPIDGDEVEAGLLVTNDGVTRVTRSELYAVRATGPSVVAIGVGAAAAGLALAGAFAAARTWRQRAAYAAIPRA